MNTQQAAREGKDLRHLLIDHAYVAFINAALLAELTHQLLDQLEPALSEHAPRTLHQILHNIDALLAEVHQASFILTELQLRKTEGPQQP
jgi:hypothetical protein